jgi:excinuclease ABC subunit C
VDLQNELPRFRLCRHKKEDGAHYYGPFAQAGFLRSTLSEMRKKFGILLADATPIKLEDGRFRLYDDARAEIFAGHNETSEEEYRLRVEDACSFLEGKAKSWLAELREKMKKYAEMMEFERAAELRDLADALAKTIKKTRRFTQKWPQQDEGNWKGLERLHEVLKLTRPPAVIECFDISHVSGTFVVASMVRFVSGKADRRSYRKYKIRSFEGNDDFRSMEEVVGRRYSRLFESGQEFPDLIVIDGGAGQVSSALNAFHILEIDPPALIGLAKREESIVFPDEREELVLDPRDVGLRLLQQVRDEAHRFANKFNADLRSQKIKESILDDFKGLGKVRREALLKHFGSLEKLRKATVEEICQIDGIGPKFAERLTAFLKLT